MPTIIQVHNRGRPALWPSSPSIETHLPDGRWGGRRDPYVLPQSALIPCMLLFVIPVTSFPAVLPQTGSLPYTGGSSEVLLGQRPLVGAVSSHMSYTSNSEDSLLWSPGDDESEDFPPSPAPTAPSVLTAPARGTPLWSPGDDESEDFPPSPAPTAPNVSTAPARGTPLWSPGADESEDFPPPPEPTAPNVSTQPARETSARGTPVGSLLSRALRREHYAPEILHVVEPVLDQVRSDTTADRNDSDAADVMTTKPGVAATALIEAPTDTTPAPHAPDRPPPMNWADNEAFRNTSTC